jgi:hypothetical protein
MPAEYYNVTEQEMADFLEPQGFKRVAIPGTFELVWGKRVDQDGLQLTLRVFTGIVAGQSREKGEDAIRVALHWRNETGKVIQVAGSKRVHRVKNWKDNLQKRLDFWLELMPKDRCAKCGAPMVPRAKGQSKFLGCGNFPDCRFTKPVPSANEGCGN